MSIVKEDGIVLKKSYPFECPHCLKTLHAAPSFAMRDGWMNQGHGCCIYCKKPFFLEIDMETNDKMIATTHEAMGERIPSKK